MRIKLWGVRGSLPTPLNGNMIEDKIRKALTLAKPGDISSEEAIESFIHSLPFSVRNTYGGNTTTIEVDTSAGDLIIIDCGSGLKPFGMELMKGDFGKGRGTANILLSHTHWDHIQGIPFFVPLYIRGNRFNFYSALPDLKKRLDYQQVFTHFPVTFDYLQATKEFFTIQPEEDLYINDTRVLNKVMPHPGGSFGYRIEENGTAIVYTSDCEFNINEIDNIEKYRNFFADADLVIFDTQYTFEEAINKLEFGHSSAAIAIDIAGMFNVKRLVLFHHEPNYDDDKLENVLINARTYQSMNPKRAGDLYIDIAYEGMEFEL
ncbi:MAG TPA: MBL fold metallo-hydrolase [Spirochaetota bacterium]|nr:MBL fold metallo-hydrolase [Spirochaetota bacterium]